MGTGRAKFVGFSVCYDILTLPKICRLVLTQVSLLSLSSDCPQRLIFIFLIFRIRKCYRFSVVFTVVYLQPDENKTIGFANTGTDLWKVLTSAFRAFIARHVRSTSEPCIPLRLALCSLACVCLFSRHEKSET